MNNPELYLKKVRIGNESTLFLDLTEPYYEDDDAISSYRIKCIIPVDEEKAFAVYAVDHSIIACQFYLDNELIMLGDDETIQFMSMDEVRLVRDLGEIAIDGTVYTIKNAVFHIIDRAGGCQNMIIFDLEKKQ